jgi:hypothetical protein
MSKAMSKAMTTNKSMQQRKPFCKVCQDAGKPENIYTSHYTRESADPKSKVVCPTLLALECRYCFKNGHTVKYCSVLASNKKMQEKAARSTQQQEQKQKEQAKVATKKKASNAFAAFDSDSDEEDQQEITTKQVVQEREEFPALPSTKQFAQAAGAAAASPSMSYATMASKPGFVKKVEAPVQAKIQVQEQEAAQTTWAEEDEEDDNEEYEEAVRKARLAVIMERSYQPTIYGKASEIDWAMEDSDSDDEDW